MFTNKKIKYLEDLMSRTPCPRCGAVKQVRLTYSSGVLLISGYCRCCNDHYQLLGDILRSNMV